MKLLLVRFHVECGKQLGDFIVQSLTPELENNSFERRAQTMFETTDNGLLVLVKAEDEKSLNASLHFAIKNISFLQNVSRETGGNYFG